MFSGSLFLQIDRLALLFMKGKHYDKAERTWRRSLDIYLNELRCKPDEFNRVPELKFAMDNLYEVMKTEDKHYEAAQLQVQVP